MRRIRVLEVGLLVPSADTRITAPALLVKGAIKQAMTARDPEWRAARPDWALSWSLSEGYTDVQSDAIAYRQSVTTDTRRN